MAFAKPPSAERSELKCWNHRPVRRLGLRLWFRLRLRLGLCNDGNYSWRSRFGLRLNLWFRLGNWLRLGLRHGNRLGLFVRCCRSGLGVAENRDRDGPWLFGLIAVATAVSPTRCPTGPIGPIGMIARGWGAPCQRNRRRARGTDQRCH